MSPSGPIHAKNFTGWSWATQDWQDTSISVQTLNLGQVTSLDKPLHERTDHFVPTLTCPDCAALVAQVAATYLLKSPTADWSLSTPQYAPFFMTMWTTLKKPYCPKCQADLILLRCLAYSAVSKDYLCQQENLANLTSLLSPSTSLTPWYKMKWKSPGVANTEWNETQRLRSPPFYTLIPNHLLSC